MTSESRMSAWEIIKTYWPYRKDTKKTGAANGFPDLIPGVEEYLKWLESLTVLPYDP